MNYRFRMHWYSNRTAPLNAGRALIGQEPADAISLASRLWGEGAYAAALGCCVVDTEDGTIVWRAERQPAPIRVAGPRSLRKLLC